MKLFLVFFSLYAFAKNMDHTVSEERKAFLQDSLVEVYGQDIADEVDIREQAKSQVLDKLPEVLLNCVFNRNDVEKANPAVDQNSSCEEVISGAYAVGLSRSQVEDVIKQLDPEPDIISLTLFQETLNHTYNKAESAEQSDKLAEIMFELPENFSNCREEDSTLDAFIPDVFQDPLCGEVIKKAMESGVSYVMVKDIIDDLTVEADKVRKPRTVAKP